MTRAPRLPLVVACLLALASIAPGRASARSAGGIVTPRSDAALEPARWERRVACVLVTARNAPATDDAHCARLLAGLGPAAAPALLDALLCGRVVVDPALPTHDLALRAEEHAPLRQALRLLGHPALLRVALEGADPQASPLARRRTLLALELVGRGEDLDLCASAAATGGARTLALQRDLQRATCAIVLRDGRALVRLRQLLQTAPDEVCCGLVRGMADASGPAVLLALADELDRLPLHEPLLLSELARAAARSPRPHDPRVLLEVRERLTSPDPLLARIAAGAAAALQDDAALPALVELLEADSSGTRGSAHDALRDLTGLSYAPRRGPWAAWLEREVAWFARRRPDLEVALAAADAGNALAALRELAGHRYRRNDLIALAASALGHPSAEVRSAATSTLAALGSAPAAASSRAGAAPEPVEVAGAAARPGATAPH